MAERLMARVQKGGPDECWPWTGGGVGDYGLVLGDGGSDAKQILTHRASYMVHVGPIPDGLWVLHRCDNPPCCNPAHLFVGTPADNVADMDAKGRRVTVVKYGDDHWTRQHPERLSHGDRSPHAKLTNEQAAEVRRRYAAGNVLQRELAAEFGASQVQISRIVRGVTYAR